jgi:glycosyltransferase involved in cell wall biosynthesis
MSVMNHDWCDHWGGPSGPWNSPKHSVGTHLGEESLGRHAWEFGNRSFLSVVIVAKDEAASLPVLLREIASAMRPLCDARVRGLTSHEVIIVDDGSSDGTQSVLKDLAPLYPELKVVALASGNGQSSAMVAGIRAARGNWIATLDGDLQNDPADLVQLWHALRGHDVALGWRIRREARRSRRVISWWANWTRNLLLGQSIRDTGCSVRIFPRAVALKLPAFEGIHRFLGPLLLSEGCRLIQHPVNDRPRAHGRSHYNLWNRSLRVILDLLGVAWLMRRSVQYRVVSAWNSVGGANGSEEIAATVACACPSPEG